jgi:hypothetical protein
LTIVRIVMGALAAAALLSCAGLPRPTSGHPRQLQVFTITRELRSSGQYTYIRTDRRSESIDEPAVIGFFQAYPGLTRGIPEGDLRFLLRLALHPATWDLLTATEPIQPMIERRLAAVEAVFTDTDRLYGRTDRLEQLSHLNPVDRLKAHLLLEALQLRSLADRLAEIMRRDLEEPEAEYGGFVLLTGEPGSPLEFIPVRSRTPDDYEYRPPPGLYPLCDFALWHCHVHGPEKADLTEIDNSSRAGPSGVLGESLTSLGGDVWTCYLLTVDGLVITPTANNTLNVDFVSSEGAVLDLGVYAWGNPLTAGE